MYRLSICVAFILCEPSIAHLDDIGNTVYNGTMPAVKVIEIRKPADLTIHPYCEYFPELDRYDAEQLQASIAHDGLLEPIVLYEGQVIDGRNRLKACIACGEAPRFVEFEEVSGGMEVLPWLLVKNLFRRHLTVDQTIAVTHKAFHEQARLNAEQRKRESGKQYGRGRPKQVNQISGQAIRPRHERSTSGQIAMLAKSSRYKAEQIIKVANQAPELVEEVAKGRLSLRDAVKKTVEQHSTKTSWSYAQAIKEAVAVNQRLIASVPARKRDQFRNDLKEQL